MNARTAGQTRRLIAATAAICILKVAGAETPPQTALQDAFWACDYIATTHGTAAAPGETCAAVYEELKATKFGGNFEELVAYWQSNKAEAHARMAELLASAPVALVARIPAEAVPDKPSRASRLLAATRTYFAALAAALRND